MGVGYRVDVPPLYYVAPVSVLVHYWDHLLEGVLAQLGTTIRYDVPKKRVAKVG